MSNPITHAEQVTGLNFRLAENPASMRAHMVNVRETFVLTEHTNPERRAVQIRALSKALRYIDDNQK